MASDVGAFFTQQYLRLGPVFRVHALGRRFTVLAGPEACRTLYRPRKPTTRSAAIQAGSPSRAGPERGRDRAGFSDQRHSARADRGARSQARA